MPRSLIIFILALNIISCFAQNWQYEQSPTRQNLARIDMLNSDVGWAVSYDGLILKYDGSSWVIADSLNHLMPILNKDLDYTPVSNDRMGDIYTIRVLDEQNGWLAVNNIAQLSYYLLHFNPTKYSFSAQKFPVKFRSIDFWDLQNGFAFGEGGGYRFSSGQWLPEKLPVNVDFKCVKYVSAGHILACGENGILLENKNGKWTQIETPHTEILKDIDFISANEGWIVGYGGTIFHYKDGVITQELAGSIENLWAVDVISPTLGFAVGEKGTMLGYNGEYWDLIKLDTDIDFHDIEMVSDSSGFAIGSRGVFFKYSHKKNIDKQKHQFIFSDQVHLGSDNLMDRINDVYGVTAADFNGDDLADIYLTCYKSLNHLLINQGDGYYQDYVIESGTGGNVETRIGKQKYEYGSIAVDFDRDDDTDILLAGKRKTTRLFSNDGSAQFKDITANSNLPADLEVIDGAAADFNEDGYPDVVLADENKGIRIFLNMKYNRFSEQPAIDPISTGIRTIKTGDLNGDFHQDIIAVYQNKIARIFLNDGYATWKKSNQMIEDTWPEFVNSVTVADFDVDGFNDFYLCTADGNDALYIYNESDSAFTNKAAQWGILEGGQSYSAVTGDFDSDGHPDLFVSRMGQDYLYKNNGLSHFDEISAEVVYSKAGYLSGFNTGAALTDIDNNGVCDLIVGNSDFWSSILQNQLENRSYLRLNITGIQDTREALGARIRIWPAGSEKNQKNLIAHREVLLSSGLFSQNAQTQLFGLGNTENADISVRFLNGDEFVFGNIAANSTINVNQASRFNSTVYSISRSAARFINIPDMMWEVFRFIFFMVLIIAGVRFFDHRYNWRPAHATIYSLALIAIYLLFMSINGIFYYFLPFITLAFVSTVLVAVNEPIRKINLLEAQKQKKIHQTNMKLAQVPDINEAFELVCETLGVIHPYKFCVLYTYHSDGNFFILKTGKNIKSENFPAKILPKRQQVDFFINSQTPVLFESVKHFWPVINEDLNNSLFFPLIRKNEILGLVILQLSQTAGVEKEADTEAINNLFLQLAIAMDNLRILGNLQEQEKIAAIGSFSGGIIHNLKNPIEGLRMITEMLGKEIKPNDERFEFVEALGNGIQELKQKLVHSFDFLRDQREINENINITDLLGGIIKNYKSLNYKLFETDFPECGLFIKGHPEKLNFVFENIIQNAIEASDFSKPIEIKVSKKENEQLVNIEIIDHGVGIEDKNLDKIFNMFYSTRGNNRGLGLTLVKNVIKSHNGHINIFSKINQGTRFQVILPLTEENNE